ncbi:hypothetical protein [Frigoribacterium sp. VKM Ac-1396]|uniref:hypothetical protein n=1 Tax=Frigoribacterium sp. VKM Ac-1396 TaxID=2783821 RepID=UPI001E573DCF|nr:hypothetical protein [Frigoribacterium sp. VKM Ac-1396]
MTTSATDLASPTPHVHAPHVHAHAGATLPALRSTRGGLRLVQVHDDLARVTRAGGEVVGYVERFDDPQGDRYRAKRFLPRQRRFVEIGEFWSRDDATDCFRFA